MLNFTRISGFIAHGLMILFFAACTSSTSVPLNAPPPPAHDAPGEQTEKPSPTPVPPNEPSPSPDPGTQEKVARIYCLDQSSRNSMLNTLRADVVESYPMPGIRFFSSNGVRALDVKAPVPLLSNGRDSSLLVKAQLGSMTSPWAFYKADVDLLKQDGVLEILSKYSDEPNQFIYNQLKLPIKMADANLSRNAIVYPDDKGTYIVQNLPAKGKVALPFSARTSSNPRFVRDTWIVLDQGTQSGTLTQKFYSLKSGKTTSLPSPGRSRHHQLFGYVTPQGTFFWLEGLPGESWKLKALNNGRTTEIASLQGNINDLHLPFGVFEKDQTVYIAYVEENISISDRGQFYVKTGLLHLMKISSELKVSAHKKVEYAAALSSMVEINKTQQQAPILLRSLFFEPLSNQLYASIVVQGGLTSYNLTDDTWSIHASLYPGCLTPGWGVEILND